MRIRLFFVVVFLFFSARVGAQTSKSDSLKPQLKRPTSMTPT